MQANKGEWSELYVLFKIFDERKIKAADKDLNGTEESYVFKKIFREDGPERGLIYDLEKDGIVEIINNASGETICRIDTIDLSEKTKKIFSRIREGGEFPVFSIPEAEELMKKYRIEKIKANSTTKTDIFGIVQDNTKSGATLGFSIKSQIGGAATLLNASKKTNFTYEVLGIDDIDEINGCTGPKMRINKILQNGGELRFVANANEIFASNLKLTDSLFPNILAEIILDYYTGRGVGVKDLCEIYAKSHSDNFTERAIEYKIKNFLRAVALGMVPGKIWDTRLEAYGGYIVVKNDGEVVCYHLYNDDEFKDYLFENTKLDTPSTTRHEFGFVYNKDGKMFMDLNLQIRFIR